MRANMSEQQIHKTPRTEAVIAKVMARYPGEGKKELAEYYEAVHQEIAPLCRELEREVAALKENMREMWRQIAMSQQVPAGWQPIDTAPKFTEVLCWRDDQGIFIAELTTPDGVMSDSEIEECAFHEDFEEWFHIGWGWLEGYLKPTHWMPLPQPPISAAPSN